MTHSHEYRFWHAHEHEHVNTDKGIDGWEPEGHDYYMVEHDTGHYHIYAQTHDHGLRSASVPHSHKEKQHHPENDMGGPYSHHALEDHRPLDD